MLRFFCLPLLCPRQHTPSGSFPRFLSLFLAVLLHFLIVVSLVVFHAIFRIENPPLPGYAVRNTHINILRNNLTYPPHGRALKISNKNNNKINPLSTELVKKKNALRTAHRLCFPIVFFCFSYGLSLVTAHNICHTILLLLFFVKMFTDEKPKLIRNEMKCAPAL